MEKNIIAAGGLKHIDAGQILLKEGCRQEDLREGGIDLETDEIDYDSMINLRPTQDNPSREALSQRIRAKINQIVEKILK